MRDIVGQAGVREFYDDLAATYDQIYTNWRRSVTRQASALNLLIRGELGDGPVRGLDCACGIGTQLVGLAALGFEMSGSDLSPVAAARAKRECVARGLLADVCAANMCALPFRDGSFDLVVCADNSLPHLLTAGDVAAALGQMRRVARPGAVLAVSTRDYDDLNGERPLTAPVQRFTDGALRTVTTQLWDWRGASPIYDITHLQVSEVQPQHWMATSRTTTYRAWLRRDLATLASEVGLREVRWILPKDSGFFQPIMLARV